MSSTGALAIWKTAIFPGRKKVSDIEYMAAIAEGVKISGSAVRSNSASVSATSANVDIVVSGSKDGYLAGATVIVHTSGVGGLPTSWNATLQAPIGTQIEKAAAGIDNAGYSFSFTNKGTKLVAGQTFRLIISASQVTDVTGLITIIEVPTGVSPVLP